MIIKRWQTDLPPTPDCLLDLIMLRLQRAFTWIHNMIALRSTNGAFITVSLSCFFPLYLAIYIVLRSVQLPT